MKFPPFEYIRPESLSEALEALETDESRVLAGGQSLLPLMALRLSWPELLVDVGRLKELSDVNHDAHAATLTIGAAVTHAAVADNPTVKRHAPFLVTAAGHIGHEAIRARGTIGGSIAHCDPAAEWVAVAVALGATVQLESRKGARAVPAGEFVAGPYMTAIDEGEMVTAIEFDLSSRPTVGIAEASRRPGDFAMAGAVCVQDGTTGATSLTLFGVATSPVRLDLGPGRSEADVSAAARDWIDAIDGVTDDAQASARLRVHLAKQMVDAALANARHGQSQGRVTHAD